jgi:protease-4
VSLETDLLLDRRRLKRRLFFWRVAALLALLIAAGVGFGRAGGTGRSAHVARLTVAGIITDDRKLIEAVDALAEKSAVRAVIVAIDSPGGSVAGGESLHAAIARVAAKKPVVAVMGATAASAGYMIAMPAERVFARDSTLTGSIGVILQTAEISGLLTTVGITAEAITSGPLKDQPSMTRGLTDPGRAVLHGMVMDMYDQFVGMVAKGRKMEPDRVRELADGRAYTGRQAFKLGLVDEIGGEREARAWLAAAKQIPTTWPTEEVERRSLTDRAFESSLGSILKTVLSQGLKLDGVLALWQPSLVGR